MHRLWLILGVLMFGGAKCIDVDSFWKYTTNSTKKSSGKCDLHLQMFYNATLNGDLWAIQMLDSSGSLPTGILKGNTQDLGYFDECIEIAENVADEFIKGKYCYGGLVIPLALLLNLSYTVTDPYKVPQSDPKFARWGQIDTRDGMGLPLPDAVLTSICIPHECIPSDIFGELGVDAMCTINEELELDGGDISFIVFFAVILTALILSTAYDIYLKRTERKSVHPVLTAFSVYTNGKKIVKTSNNKEQILCFNGLKVMSLFWVIAGHRYSSFQGAGSMNAEDAEKWKDRWYSIYMTMAPLSVDTFLYVAGVLVSYNFLKTMKRPNARFNIFLYYLHRYIRLTPALAALFFFQVTVARKLGSGPMWNFVQEMMRDNCLNSWPSVFFYYHNYLPPAEMCLGHLWYLSLDMHAFLLSPLLLLPLLKYPKIAKRYLLPGSILAAILTPMVILYVYDLRYQSDDYNIYYYYLTHTRILPWVIGVAFGSFLLSQQTKARQSLMQQYISLMMWAVTFIIIGVIFWTLNSVIKSDDRLETTFYVGFQRLVWTVCLCWITFACIFGYGGIINWFLSCGAFQVISKLSYSTYLMHLSWMIISVGNDRVLFYFDDITGMYKVCGDIFFSLLIGTFWTLAFESPMITIEKVIFGIGSNRNRKENNLGEKREDIPPRQNPLDVEKAVASNA